MKVYNYNPINKVFTYSEEAFLDPLNPGQYLIPVNATIIATPDECKHCEVFIFNEQEQKWHTVDLTPPYWQLRAQAYPSIFEYIDGVVKNDHEQINKYIRECRRVKEYFPKPDNISYDI